MQLVWHMYWLSCPQVEEKSICFNPSPAATDQRCSPLVALMETARNYAIATYQLPYYRKNCHLDGKPLQLLERHQPRLFLICRQKTLLNKFKNGLANLCLKKKKITLVDSRHVLPSTVGETLLGPAYRRLGVKSIYSTVKLGLGQ